MFVLTKIADTIRIQPADLEKNTLESLEQEINRKFANKVLHNVGLCVCMYDIETYEDGLIRPGDGAIYIKTVFRLVVFRPFVGEILVGWVSSCTEYGINVKVEFFDDIHIPRSLLFEDCTFVPREQAWVWKNGDSELYIDTNEKIRFRVEQELFNESQPTKPKGEMEGEDNGPSDAYHAVPPYSIIGSCQVDGMGLVSWWE